MSFRKFSGIILGSKPYRERDNLFFVFTERYGKIVLVGHGTRKLKHRFGEKLYIGNLVDITAFDKNFPESYPSISDVEVKKPFYTYFSKDSKKFALLFSIVEIVYKTIPLASSEPSIYKFLLEFLSAYSMKTPRTSLTFWLSLLVFYIYTLKIEGYISKEFVEKSMPYKLRKLVLKYLDEDFSPLFPIHQLLDIVDKDVFKGASEINETVYINAINNFIKHSFSQIFEGIDLKSLSALMLFSLSDRV